MASLRSCNTKHFYFTLLTPVRPPGITATSVLRECTLLVTFGVRWALNWSHTSKDFLFRTPPGRRRQTFSSQISQPCSTIQPWRWACTTRPLGVDDLTTLEFVSKAHPGRILRRNHRCLMYCSWWQCDMQGSQGAFIYWSVTRIACPGCTHARPRHEVH